MSKKAFWFLAAVFFFSPTRAADAQTWVVNTDGLFVQQAGNFCDHKATGTIV